jgi:hypothetical protein
MKQADENNTIEMKEADTTSPQQVTVETPIVVLQNCIKCIDAAAQRGAFQGNELSTVGGVRDIIQGLIDNA